MVTRKNEWIERDLFANINEEDKIQSWLLVAVTVFWNDLEVETSWIVGLIKAGSGDGYNCTVNKKNKGNKYYGRLEWALQAAGIIQPLDEIRPPRLVPMP